MPKDVIFLGAGASKCAGFPINRELTRYIIYEMASRRRFEDAAGTYKIKQEGNPVSAQWKGILEQWSKAAESLRRSKELSVDEYCLLASPNGAVTETTLHLKRMLRSALMDFAPQWREWNDYGPFISDLFKPKSADLDDRFTIVNFNYDGLFGKLLTDAVLERWQIHKGVRPPVDYLSELAGGYFPQGGLVAVEATDVKSNSFVHVLPHGTITTLQKGSQKLCIQDLLYAVEYSGPNLNNRAEMEADFYENLYMTTPMIHFPWEPSACAPVFERQLDIASRAVVEAERIHFIGISGHPLLGHTLQKIFRVGTREPPLEFLSNKQWHIATMEPNHEATFWKIAQCFIPQLTLYRQFEEMMIGRATGNLRRVSFYKGFSDWLERKPYATE